METYRTRLPLSHNLIVGFVFSFAGLLLFNNMSIIGTIIYSVIMILIIYFLVFNKNCVVTMTEDLLIIKYIMPYYSNKTFEIKNIKNIYLHEGEVVFYKFWLLSWEARERRQDKLIIISEDNHERYLISTNKTDLKELLKNLTTSNT